MIIGKWSRYRQNDLNVRRGDFFKTNQKNQKKVSGIWTSRWNAIAKYSCSCGMNDGSKCWRKVREMKIKQKTPILLHNCRSSSHSFNVQAHLATETVNLKFFQFCWSTDETTGSLKHEKGNYYVETRLK